MRYETTQLRAWSRKVLAGASIGTSRPIEGVFHVSGVELSLRDTVPVTVNQSPSRPSRPSAEPGSRLIIAVALLGLVLVVATMLWFDDDGSDTETDRAAEEQRESAKHKGASSTEPKGRHTDDASLRGGREYGAHLGLPSQVSEDPSRFGALEGKVVDGSTRVGVAGAELAFVHNGVAYETSTQADGRYRFEASAAGRWSLAMVTAEGYLPYAPELGSGSVAWVARPRQKLERADLFLFPAIDYVGTVVDKDGQPVADAEVELFGADSGERALVGMEASYRSDADGRFEFHAPNFAMIEARHADHPPGRARVDQAAQVTHTLTIVMGSAPRPSAEVISGRVVDADGAPLAGIEIQSFFANRGEPTPPLGRAPTTVSDAEGGFVLSPLDRLYYVVRATPSGQPWVQTRPVKPGAVVELKIVVGLAVEGRLVDEAGDVVVAGTVELSRVMGSLGRRRVAGLSIFDADGGFRFEGLQPGPYELRATAQGRSRSEPVLLTLPYEGDPVRVVLGTGGSVYGRVVDGGSGDPIAGVEVSVRGLSPDDSVLSAHSSTVSAVDGRFELGGIRPGRASIQLRAQGHDGRILTGVEIVAGDRTGPFDVSLDPVVEGERPKVELAGIGVTITSSREAIFVRSVVEGGGARAAGIVAGDAIIAVDGVSVTELGFEGAMQNIRGQAGTTVRVGLRRKGGEEQTLEVERRVLRTP